MIDKHEVELFELLGDVKFIMEVPEMQEHDPDDGPLVSVLVPEGADPEESLVRGYIEADDIRCGGELVEKFSARSRLRWPVFFGEMVGCEEVKET